MTFLLANWKYIAVALAVAVYTGFVYRAGGNAPRAEIAAMVAAGRAQDARVAAVDTHVKEIVHVADKNAAARFSAIDAYFLHKPAGSVEMPHFAPVAIGTQPTPAPSVPDTDRHCTDQDSAHDAEQVILIQKFYADLTEAQK